MYSESLTSYLSFIVPVLMLIPGCSSQDGADTGQHAQDLAIVHSPIEITWEVISNFEEGNKLSAALTFHNTGDEAFAAGGWTLYLNSIRALDPESFLPALEATHISGDFFKLEPADSFTPIPPGESRRIEYLADFHAIKKTDAPSGLYFVFDDHIETVENISVKPFVNDEQINRTPDDRLDVPTAESRYRTNESLARLGSDQVGKITPTPVSVKYGEGVYNFAEGVDIYFVDEFSDEAGYLSRWLSESFGIESTLEPLGSQWNGTGIALNTSRDSSMGDEGYEIQISPEAIELTANGNAGIFYAIQSLRSLLSNRDSENVELPSVKIDDHPQFVYRGMHLDVARNFQQKESVLRLLDVMGLYKLNKFHFHLTDDEGWRLEIDELPELTEVGGRRGHTETDENYLIPAYGSGPDPAPGNSFGSGWFSRDEYIEILKFANQRHIEVIPEIDVPGHARAAIKAMEARYTRLMEAGETEQADMYRLIDPEDESEYTSVQNFDDNVMNVCGASTYRFMELVFDEIISMHDEAGVPLNMIHVGGDEVPGGVWEESPACDRYRAEHSIENVSSLFGHFFDRLETMLDERGLKMAGWEEVALGDDHESAKDDPAYMESVVPYVWSSIWGSGREDYAYMLANAGYEIVMSNASNLYLDMAYNKSWEEPGFYWAAMFGTKDTYSFIPYNLYKNADHDNYGNPVSPGEYEDAIQLTESGRENILGIQGQLWSETVNKSHRWEYMVLPRLLGLAERAWVGNPSWGETENPQQMNAERDTAWNEFANRIGQFELNRISRIYEDINYRLPVPGAIVEEGFVKANSAFPGLEIRYETGGGLPTANSPVYTGPLQLSGIDTVTFSVFNSQGRSGRAISISAPETE